MLFSRPLIIDEQLATPPSAQAAPLYFSSLSNTTADRKKEINERKKTWEEEQER